MPPLSPGKGALQFIPAHQATSGSVKGSNPSPRSSKGPAHPSAWATLKLPVTPSPSKKAKASVSKSRPKTPSVAQKAKFTNDVGVTPSGSIKVYHPLAGPPPNPSPGLLPWSSSPHPSTPYLTLDLGHHQTQQTKSSKALRSLPLPPSVSCQMQRLQLEMANSHPKSAFLALEAEGQPSFHLGLQLVGTSADGGKLTPSPLHLHMHQQAHPGVEMEDDDASREGSGEDAWPPLPIPPPFHRPGPAN
ncbi:hypothetical protein PAXRUDRAFT_20635 [Paxillus rubicundulus Ve08.2h10]|uniref:Unplaced genomic scaffold scaffold_4726, whole genome shotgun sequence n=1 Tax=Paxillus rubicundulus Ve08.2h10 TaxID=930991 RepID=A0A0D0BQ45_9AGAM|nr:hypothetical protein PAXRUDRAFT_20635 [Paxillus rubicundulus Ve08.2h10]